MTAETAAEMIATELLAVVTEETMVAYLTDESGNDDLRYFENIVAARLGGSYDPAAWDDAMEVLAEMPEAMELIANMQAEEA